MLKRNNQTIKNACERFRLTKDEIIRQGMYGLLEDAVQYALEAHDDKHRSHIELGDTYGWMLVHNRKIEEIVTVATSQNVGRATEQLRKHLSKVPSTGWVGVVMAGLEPASYFSVIYEMGMIDFAMQMTEQNFSQYFTKL